MMPYWFAAPLAPLAFTALANQPTVWFALWAGVTAWSVLLGCLSAWADLDDPPPGPTWHGGWVPLDEDGWWAR